MIQAMRRASEIVEALPLRVLVVEDDGLNRMFYQAVLERRGYSVRLVDDGARVLDEVRQFRPDLITMDIHLPNVSGLKLIELLRRDSATRDIPVIAVTAFAGTREEQRIRRAGAKGYLAKPVTIPQLLGEIDAVFPG